MIQSRMLPMAFWFRSRISEVNERRTVDTSTPVRISRTVLVRCWRLRT